MATSPPTLVRAATAPPAARLRRPSGGPARRPAGGGAGAAGVVRGHRPGSAAERRPVRPGAHAATSRRYPGTAPHVQEMPATLDIAVAMAITRRVFRHSGTLRTSAATWRVPAACSPAPLAGGRRPAGLGLQPDHRPGQGRPAHPGTHRGRRRSRRRGAAGLRQHRRPLPHPRGDRGRRHHRIIAVSPPAAALLGATAHDLVGRRITTVIRPACVSSTSPGSSGTRAPAPPRCSVCGWSCDAAPGRHRRPTSVPHRTGHDPRRAPRLAARIDPPHL